MKKLLVVFVYAVLMSFSVGLASAKSGCCSGHDGVNCGAGAQGNGNVICNDGWRGSSCCYSEMVMCGGASAPAVTQPSQPSVVTTTTLPEPQKAVVEKPKPTLSPEQLAKQKCDTATKKISTRIKTQEKKKETNLTALNKSVTSLQSKITTSQEKNLDVVPLVEKVDSVVEDIKEYQASYDEYTNKLYEISWVICGEDKDLIKELEQEGVELAKPLPKTYLDLQKQVNQAKVIKLKATPSAQ